MCDTINDVRWIRFNESNKRSVIIILTMSQVPRRIKFTDTVSVNYELGIRVRNYLEIYSKRSWMYLIFRRMSEELKTGAHAMV
jgi:hypothetical protein